MSEPKCVCELGSSVPMCGKQYKQSRVFARNDFCAQEVGHDPCRHPRACHQPLPAANTQETSNV